MALSELPGLYVGVDSYDVVVGPLFVTTGRKFLCVYSGGVIVNGYPDYGLETTQPDETDPFTGRYMESGGALEIEWNDGTRSTAERIDTTVFRLFGTTYARLDRCTDMELDGTYMRQGGDPAWPVIVFHPDRRFEDGGVLSYTGLTATARWREATEELAQIRGSGQWRVSNNTLYLDYEGFGQLSACVYVPFGRDTDNPIAEIDLNGYSFERRESQSAIPPATWTRGQL